MSEDTIDYGPLSALNGKFKGSRGFDIIPEVDGQDEYEYYETITFTPIGMVTNVDTQDLAAVHYWQVVQDKETDEFKHNQTGYYLWDAENKRVINSFTIPRGVCVLASGKYAGETDDEGNTVLEFSASHDDENWSISQSPFMKKMAKSLSFTQKLTIGDGTVDYEQTTLLDIFGRNFEHSESNRLTLD